MNAEQKSKPKPKPIKVTVSFPPAPGGPYHDEVKPATTVGDIRAAAMAKFGIEEDSQFTYYLTHAGQRHDDTEQIGDIAGDAKAVKFTLIKEIVQG